MKNYLLVGMMLVLILHNLFAAIKNGYEKDLPKLRISIEGLKTVLSQNKRLTAAETRRIKLKIKAFADQLSYYEVTEQLLQRFRAIAPELYQEIDTLKDRNGNAVDVYVKFLPKDEAGFESTGIMSFSQSEHDPNSCVSEYGTSTASVKVWIVNTSLAVLAHEFGHLKYIIPNLSAYVDFYRKMYGGLPRSDSFGHSAGDPSGRNAFQFEKRYKFKYIKYLRLDSDEWRSPLTLLNRVKSNTLERAEVKDSTLVVRGW